MAQFLTCMGEILIDFFPIEEHGQTVGFRMFPGGAPMNVAIGLARLGQPTAFVSKVSTDYFGRFLRHYLEAEQVNTRFLMSDPALSTLAFVAVENNEPTFTFYGEGAADTLLSVDDLPPELFEQTRVLQIGGISLLRGTTPNTILAAVERMHGHALIAFDPNIRPALVEDGASYRALLDKLFGMADLIKISAVDLDWLMPGKALNEAAAEVAGRGAALVVVTRGAHGAMALRSTDGAPEIFEAPGFRVTVADTVGAGDAFNSGLLAALAEQGALTRAALQSLPPNEIQEILRFASATAALNVQKAGANPPTRAEVAAFLGQHA
jgi:fructokinase